MVATTAVACCKALYFNSGVAPLAFRLDTNGVFPLVMCLRRLGMNQRTQCARLYQVPSASKIPTVARLVSLDHAPDSFRGVYCIVNEEFRDDKIVGIVQERIESSRGYFFSSEARCVAVRESYNSEIKSSLSLVSAWRVSISTSMSSSRAVTSSGLSSCVLDAGYRSEKLMESGRMAMMVIYFSFGDGPRLPERLASQVFLGWSVPWRHPVLEGVVRSVGFKHCGAAPPAFCLDTNRVPSVSKSPTVARLVSLDHAPDSCRDHCIRSFYDNLRVNLVFC
ncbi:hypothetical protein Tco_1368749 [Tanacetum coccineum]